MCSCCKASALQRIVSAVLTVFTSVIASVEGAPAMSATHACMFVCVCVCVCVAAAAAALETAKQEEKRNSRCYIKD